MIGSTGDSFNGRLDVAPTAKAELARQKAVDLGPTLVAPTSAWVEPSVAMARATCRSTGTSGYLHTAPVVHALVRIHRICAYVASQDSPPSA